MSRDQDIDDENEIELKGRGKAEEKIFRGREENFTENTRRKKIVTIRYQIFFHWIFMDQMFDEVFLSVYLGIVITRNTKRFYQCRGGKK